ncbi:O-acetyl-ADP-ribose deacetylase (regulator of RNase III), contains Macro domain [Lentibacillus persicus]|uniref:O-acetyl-ADP-ribose deacetylase (Regulator of RNase III), contains Macro domain n=1 Tax=Lentibacillus persicus TaxID=640948 RepID=A0A1I1SDW7_9BACI|nr:protein-ADP-ribose hydrolase [Lentibacillus persicus]SFD41180.1 O-acetyl-ADP-ribose deacetylase (regulator of RNase III), contains Macro domain [Lentibacillus persicus]
MDQEARLDYLIDYLWHKNPKADAHFGQYKATNIEEKTALFQGLCNVRQPEPVTDEFVKVQDAFLTQWNNERELTSLRNLEDVRPQLYVWQGDITRLAVDAIVNAANSDMLGCTKANHECIDNRIHTRAGVQLRLECHELMKAQGRKEPMGKAKITKAYNLPSNYVIHTVGPFIDARGVSPLKEQLLASSYQSCLALADAYQLDTIAFCCISTGEFNFPNQRAAEIAIQMVEEYLRKTESNLHVIFNVFKDEDLEIYQSLLAKNE